MLTILKQMSLYLKKILPYAVFLTSALQTALAANPKGTINVLTWWNYLTPPEIASIVKKKCNVTLYYDEYYCNSELLKRFPSNKAFYDIIIFPTTVYEVIKEKIELKNSSLNNITKNYEGGIRERYQSYKYPSNVVFFALSLLGFIWNPETITLLVDDTNFSMFNKAKDGIVIIVNDPVGVENLVNRQMLFVSSTKNKYSFKQIAQNTTIYITNGYNKLYDSDKFTFALQRSGDAVFTIKTSKKSLNFLSHPDFSYIAPDLLAELNTRPETQCAAKVLASKEVLDIVQKNSYFLSPYGTYKSASDSIFQNVYKQLHNICDIQWLKPIPIDKYKDLLKKWDDIAILPQILKTTATPRF